MRTRLFSGPRTRFGPAAFAAVLLVATLCLVPGIALAGMETYAIDPGHSSVGFSIKHFFSMVPGHFNKFGGTIQLDPKDLGKGSVTVTIDATSIDTNHEERDKHLRSADFFDVANHATITFTSTRVKPAGKNKARVEGTLTLRGVSKPVTLDVDVLGMGPDAWGGYRGGFQAKIRINRKDFGLTWNKTLDTGGLILGEEVDIVINIEGVRQSPETAAKASNS